MVLGPELKTSHTLGELSATDLHPGFQCLLGSPPRLSEGGILAAHPAGLKLWWYLFYASLTWSLRILP